MDRRHRQISRFLSYVLRHGPAEIGLQLDAHGWVSVAAARAVGTRHGAVVVLVVRAGDMSRAGLTFYVSQNGVWLTEHVPSTYIQYPDT